MMCMLDFILLYIIRYKGRSNNSHKNVPQEFQNDSPTVCQQRGWVFLEGGTGVTTGDGGTGMSCTPNEFVL